MTSSYSPAGKRAVPNSGMRSEVPSVVRHTRTGSVRWDPQIRSHMVHPGLGSHLYPQQGMAHGADRAGIQSSAVITRSNISTYCIYHCRNWGIISIRAEPTKDIPYLALTGELWGAFREYFWKNWPRYNGTALYIGNPRSHSSSSDQPWWCECAKFIGTTWYQIINQLCTFTSL